MQRAQKLETVAELKDSLAKAQSIVVADYRGLTVEQVNGLRSEIRKSDCRYRVLKNTLVKRAIEGTPLEGIGEMLKGPTAIAYSHRDPIAPAKVLDKFAEDLEKLELKGGYLEGEVLDAKGVRQLAKMKGKDELRAEFLALLSAPAQGLVRLFNAVPSNFLYLLQARERSQSEG